MQRVEIIFDDQLNREQCLKCAHVTIINTEMDVKEERLVTIDSLMKAFGSSIIKETEMVPLGRMPFGYFDGAIRMEQGKFSAEVVAVLPASKQIVTYEKTKYDICMPSLVFSFKVQEERLAETKVFTIKDDIPKEKSRLYRYPFGNVFDSGSVCWGNNCIPRIKDLKGLEMIMTLFIQSPCNDDLYNSEKCIGVKELPLRQLLQNLKDKNVFPEEYLRPIKNQKKAVTIKDVMLWKKYL